MARGAVLRCWCDRKVQSAAHGQAAVAREGFYHSDGRILKSFKGVAIPSTAFIAQVQEPFAPAQVPGAVRAD